MESENEEKSQCHVYDAKDCHTLARYPYCEEYAGHHPYPVLGEESPNYLTCLLHKLVGLGLRLCSHGCKISIVNRPFELKSK